MGKIESNVCRTCLNDNNCQETLDNSHLRNIFTTLTSLEVQLDDGLPINICDKCTQKLDEFDAFRDMCITSHSRLTGKQIEKRELKVESECAIEDSFTNLQNDDISIDQISDHEECSEEQTQHVRRKSGRKLISRDNNANLSDAKQGIKAKKDKFLCTSCNEEFAFAISLKKHIKTAHKFNHNEKQTWVPDEDVKWKRRAHIGKSNLSLSCPKCGQGFKKPDRLEAHLRVHDGKKPEVCKECNGEFANWKSLKLHKMTHTGIKKYVCSDCGKRFTYPTALQIHQRIHTGIREYICDKCGNTFLTSTNLKLHLTTTHSIDRPFNCEVCGQKFKCISTLRMHLFRHSGVKNFVCSLCGHRSTTKGELNAHMKTHSQEKPYGCTVCVKSYKTSHELNIHNRTHTGERPYMCDLCPMSFMISKVLKHHRMTHTGEKPHSCAVCQRAFTQKGALRTHMKTHDKT